MADESQVLTAVLAAINAEPPTAVEAKEPPKMAATMPAEFLHVTIAPRAGAIPRAGRRSAHGWAVYVTAGSSTYAANARTLLARASRALENRVLVVGDEQSTPVELRPSRTVGPSSTHYLGTNLYHFVI